MELERLISYFSTSPSARLLRSQQAAHVVYFLHQEFKTTDTISIPHSRLVSRLESFQEDAQARGDGVLADRAGTYLANWSTGDSRFLHRYHDAQHKEAVYELAPHTEEVLKFLDQILYRDWEFVGTESRLKRIINTLQDIVVRGSADPEQRLEHLYLEQQRIQNEIDAIEAGEDVEVYSSTAIKERFTDAVNDLNSLQGDFRAVEAAFKTITRDVQQFQFNSTGTRGEILGYALDAEDSLKSQDQGISFDEFVRLVLSERKQDELDEIVCRLDQLAVLVDQVDKKRRIRGMMDSLSLEAEKVIRTTRRLSATLRRLLDSNVSASRVHLASVLAEIRMAAMQRAELGIDNHIQLVVETKIDITNVFERKLWTMPVRFDQTELWQQESGANEQQSAFQQLAMMRRIDWKRMRNWISESLVGRDSLSLPELLELHPVDGEVEVLALIQIANDDGHDVSGSETEQIRLPKTELGFESGGDSLAAYEVPRIIFQASRARHSAPNSRLKKSRPR